MRELLEIKTMSSACCHQYPLIFTCTISALHEQHLWHVQTIKDQALHGRIEDHESLCDQTAAFLAEDQ